MPGVCRRCSPRPDSASRRAPTCSARLSQLYPSVRLRQEIRLQFQTLVQDTDQVNRGSPMPENGVKC